MKKNFKRAGAAIVAASMMISSMPMSVLADQNNNGVKALGALAEVASKTAELKNREENLYTIELSVPGAESEKYNEVIIMADASTSITGSTEEQVRVKFGRYKNALKGIGKELLNGTGNVQLSLMGFGLGPTHYADRRFIDAAEWEAAIESLVPDDLLQGRSATNCEVGFNFLQDYIQDSENLNSAAILYISDGAMNFHEEPVEFTDILKEGSDWKYFRNYATSPTTWIQKFFSGYQADYLLSDGGKLVPSLYDVEAEDVQEAIAAIEDNDIYYNGSSYTSFSKDYKELEEEIKDYLPYLEVMTDSASMSVFTDSAPEFDQSIFDEYRYMKDEIEKYEDAVEDLYFALWNNAEEVAEVDLISMAKAGGIYNEEEGTIFCTVSEFEKAFYTYLEGAEISVDAFGDVYFILLGCSTDGTVGRTRTVAAANALCDSEEYGDKVSKLVLLGYGDKNGWMNPNGSATTKVTSAKAEYVHHNNVASAVEAISEEISNFAVTPYNEVSVTDYMSKWVTLKPETIKIYDGEDVICEYNEESSTYEWADGIEIPTVKNPITVERVPSEDYTDGGSEVVGNTNGDIYKITWNIKDGALLTSDNYTMRYDVVVDTKENGFVYDTEYSANGTTEVHYTDENGESQHEEIEVPNVNAESKVIIAKKDSKYQDESYDQDIKKFNLAGAELKVVDSKGNTVYTWTSTETPINLGDHTPIMDGSYTLVEVNAPEKYEIAKDIPFVIEDGKASVVMFDERASVPMIPLVPATPIVPETTEPETTPEETTPAETTAPETTPVETTPAETTAPETTPVETTPAETTAPETTPVETTPAETTPASTEPEYEPEPEIVDEPEEVAPVQEPTPVDVIEIEENDTPLGAFAIEDNEIPMGVLPAMDGAIPFDVAPATGTKSAALPIAVTGFTSLLAAAYVILFGKKKVR